MAKQPEALLDPIRREHMRIPPPGEDLLAGLNVQPAPSVDQDTQQLQSLTDLARTKPTPANVKAATDNLTAFPFEDVFFGDAEIDNSSKRTLGKINKLTSLLGSGRITLDEATDRIDPLRNQLVGTARRRNERNAVGQRMEYQQASEEDARLADERVRGDLEKAEARRTEIETQITQAGGEESPDPNLIATLTQQRSEADNELRAIKAGASEADAALAQARSERLNALNPDAPMPVTERSQGRGENQDLFDHFRNNRTDAPTGSLSETLLNPAALGYSPEQILRGRQAAPTNLQGPMPPDPKVSVGGLYGERVDIPGAAVGTAQGRSLATQARGLSQAQGEIPAGPAIPDRPTIKVTTDSTGRMVATTGSEDGSGMPVNEMPVDAFLNERARERAEIEANRGGRETQVDIPASRRGSSIARFILPTLGTKSGLSERQRLDDKRRARADVVAVLGADYSKAGRKALKEALKRVDKTFADRGKRRPASILERAQGRTSADTRRAQSDLRKAEDTLSDVLTLDASEKLRNPAADNTNAIGMAKEAVGDAAYKLENQRKVEAGADAKILKTLPPSVVKRIKRQGKELKGWMSVSKNTTLFNKIATGLEKFVEGTIVGSGENQYYPPGKGSVIPGRGFRTVDDGKGHGTTTRVLQAGEITADALDITWKMLTDKYRGQGVPDSVLAHAMDGLLAIHDEWPQDVVTNFKRRHKDVFRVQLLKPNIRQATPQQFDALKAAIAAGRIPNELLGVWATLSNQQKDELAKFVGE